MTRIFSVGSNFLSKLAPLSFIKSLIFLYFNVLRPHILLISIFLCLFGAPPFFLFFFFLSQFWRPFLLNLYFTILIISPPFRSVLCCFLFCALWRPFLHLCCCLFTPVYSHFLYFIVLRPHILLISIFLCLFGAAFLSLLFSFLNFDAPICLSYILLFLLSYRPSVLYYFGFLFVLRGAPSFTFIAVCLRLYIPIFAILALLSFLLQFLSFKSLSICHLFLFFFPFPSILCPLFSFSSPFPFTFLFLSPFPFPFLLFSPSSLSSSFLLPLLTPLLVTFWRPLVATRGASARYAPPKIRHWSYSKLSKELKNSAQVPGPTQN